MQDSNYRALLNCMIVIWIVILQYYSAPAPMLSTSLNDCGFQFEHLSGYILMNTLEKRLIGEYINFAELLPAKGKSRLIPATLLEGQIRSGHVY